MILSTSLSLRRSSGRVTKSLEFFKLDERHFVLGAADVTLDGDQVVEADRQQADVTGRDERGAGPESLIVPASARFTSERSGCLRSSPSRTCPTFKRHASVRRPHANARPDSIVRSIVMRDGADARPPEVPQRPIGARDAHALITPFFLATAATGRPPGSRCRDL